jgi:pyruvate dehydrogenase E2 component (dihydrolipoamide acetyltransferase)
MAEVTMPRLSDTMSEGSVGRWLKKPGDRVEKDEVIAEIETDKATMELVAFESGTLQQILVPEGQVVPIGEVIGMIGDGPAPAGAAAPAAASDAAKEPTAKETKTDAPTDAKAGAKKPAAADASAKSATNGAAANGTPTAAPAASGAASSASASSAAEPAYSNGTQAQAGQAAAGERIKASPLARRIAEAHGLNLRDVPGTGPGGRILKANVEEFRRKSYQPQAAKPAAGAGTATGVSTRPATPVATPPPPTGAVEPMSRMRRAIARAMTESKPGVPHIYLTAEIDMHAAMALRAQINDSGAIETKLSPNDLIVTAVAKALAKFPLINASFVTTPDGQPAVVRHPQINVSVAVATDEGLMAPVVRDADKKGLGAIAAEIRELATRAREGKVKQGDLEGATFQTSNLGMFDVTEFVSIITLPQAGSLAIGAVRQTPVVRDGQIVIGEIMNVTLSVDHRVADGALAAKFLQELTRLLQAPLSLLL